MITQKAQSSQIEKSPIKWVGVVIGLAIFVAMMAIGPPTGLSHSAWSALAILALMVTWWISEAIPVAATSLLPLAALPIFGVTTPAKAAAPYADPIIYMFVGGFILAAAVEQCGLHRRIALGVLSRVGGSQPALVTGFMIATTALSMWISNTATSLMMTPIALAVAGATVTDPADRRKLAAACVLGVAYAASIGGLGTPVGSPTNLVGLRWLQEQGVEINFLQWMGIGLTIIVLVLPVAWWLLTCVVYKLPKGNLVGSAREIVATQASALGPITKTQVRVLIIFVCVALCWMLREPICSKLGLEGVTDMGIAIIGAMALFLVPAGDPVRPNVAILDWKSAEKIPWGIVILFGGGLSMAAALSDTGVTRWVAGNMSGLGTMPTILVVVTLLAVTIFLSELSSNVATLTTMLPVVSAIVLATGADPLTVGAAVTFAASFGFMLPIATAPNSIAYATGQPKQSEMIRIGLSLNILGIIVITAVISVARHLGVV